MIESAKTLLAGIVKGELRSIAKAVTLVESQKPSDVVLADELLAAIMPHTGRAIRLGISGIPGVGKSTFIEALGLLLIDRGLRVAVLAIDPSSPVSGGSILGDKTRMERLSASHNAFVRPSPSLGSLGGVARKTRETSLVMEASGFDVVIIETVGVGQSEIVVSSMVDAFLMLQMPSTGDELQMFKKGILEVADVIAINKADGELRVAAERAAVLLKSTFSLIVPHESTAPSVVICSARDNKNIEAVWNEVEAFISRQRLTGHWQKRRERQLTQWFDEEIGHQLIERFISDRQSHDLLAEARRSILAGQAPVSTTARQIVRQLVTLACPG